MTKPLQILDVKDKALASVTLQELVERTSINSDGNLHPSIRENIKRLSRLPFSEALEVFSESAELQFTINQKAFEISIKSKRVFSTEQECFEWMVSVGATNSMLTYYFPALMDRKEVAILRRSFGETASFKRITHLRSHTEKLDIVNEYFQLGKQIEISPYERLRELYFHYKGAYHIVQLFAVLKESGDL